MDAWQGLGLLAAFRGQTLDALSSAMARTIVSWHLFNLDAFLALILCVVHLFCAAVSGVRADPRSSISPTVPFAIQQHELTIASCGLAAVPTGEKRCIRRTRLVAFACLKQSSGLSGERGAADYHQVCLRTRRDLVRGNLEGRPTAAFRRRHVRASIVALYLSK